MFNLVQNSFKKYLNKYLNNLQKKVLEYVFKLIYV